MVEEVGEGWHGWGSGHGNNWDAQPGDPYPPISQEALALPNDAASVYGQIGSPRNENGGAEAWGTVNGALKAR